MAQKITVQDGKVIYSSASPDETVNLTTIPDQDLNIQANSGGYLHLNGVRWPTAPADNDILIYNLATDAWDLRLFGLIDINNI